MGLIYDVKTVSGVKYFRLKPDGVWFEKRF